MTDGQGTVLTAVRYGSLDDCQRGTGASRDLLKDEVARWFSSSTIMGTAQRVLEFEQLSSWGEKAHPFRCGVGRAVTDRSVRMSRNTLFSYQYLY